MNLKTQLQVLFNAPPENKSVQFKKGYQEGIRAAYDIVPENNRILVDNDFSVDDTIFWCYCPDFTDPTFVTIETGDIFSIRIVINEQKKQTIVYSAVPEGKGSWENLRELPVTNVFRTKEDAEVRKEELELLMRQHRPVKREWNY